MNQVIFGHIRNSPSEIKNLNLSLHLNNYRRQLCFTAEYSLINMIVNKGYQSTLSKKMNE